MEEIVKQGNNALQSHIRIASGAGLISFFTTMLVWIQTEELGVPPAALYWALIMNACFILAPLTFCLRNTSRPVRAQTQGCIAILGAIGLIFGFCGAPLFFYFLFAEMPLPLRFCGLGLVIISGIAWAFLCWRDHVQATEQSGLLHSAAYAEYSEYIIYDQFKAGDVLSRHIHTRSPFSWPYLVGSLVIAPFGTFFYRFFGDQIGHHEMVWVLGFLTYPLYLVFISAIVQGYRQKILIPKLLTQQTGKPVFWAG
jgi:hypothetical protein